VLIKIKNMKKIAFICILLVQHVLLAQNEGNIWYFGEYAGMDLKSGVPIAVSNTPEGVASM
jgi:hypothetical protein